ncbi:MAG: ChaN family lipoprotein [Proteobacteria bacterium]|nr:ChaN family lipoprotein [Pseudomonadota bacterium]
MFVTREALFERAAAARFVMLGEAHDNPDHHRLQAEVLAALRKAGRSPALAMEQFDREHQAALDAARARGVRDPERIADAGRFDRKGWNWPQYRPLVQEAVAASLPLLAANLSREDARALMKAGRPAAGLAPAPPALRASLEQDIVEGHCGHRPSASVLAGMVEAQRARDAQMAAVLAGTDARGAVLIAGAGHTRHDRGVPAYLPADLRRDVLAIGFLEVEAGRTEPRPEYADLYDLVWFTPRAEREDPCKNLRMP